VFDSIRESFLYNLFNGGYMTASALITMLLSWSLITYYTVKFFLRVLRTPNKPDEEAEQ